jgi:hypothetical protein
MGSVQFVQIGHISAEAKRKNLNAGRRSTSAFSTTAKENIGFPERHVTENHHSTIVSTKQKVAALVLSVTFCHVPHRLDQFHKMPGVVMPGIHL